MPSELHDDSDYTTSVNNHRPVVRPVVSCDTDKAAGLLLQPFRTVAIRQQLAHTWHLVHNTANSANMQSMAPPPNMLSSTGSALCKSMVRYEGIHALYKGGATLMTGRILSAYVFAIYHTLQTEELIVDISDDQYESMSMTELINMSFHHHV